MCAGDDVESVFCLDFTATQEAFGEVQTIELIPDGASQPVTAANKRQYVAAYVRWMLSDSISRSFNAFARGFKMVASGPALDLFRPDELSQLVVGSEALDFKELEAGAEYEEPYSRGHRVVGWLWEVVHSLAPDQQRKFLAFCTGSDRSPIRGLADLRLKIQRNGPDSELLPTASTCFNTILLPAYASKEKLQQKLVIAIQESEGFGLK